MNRVASAIAGAVVLNIPTLIWAIALPVVASPIGAVDLVVLGAVFGLLGAVFGLLVVWALDAPSEIASPVVEHLPLAA